MKPDDPGDVKLPDSEPSQLPLPFKSRFRLTQAFGENPHIYRRLGLPGHNGLDWGMPVGQPIRAVDEGFVILVRDAADGFGRHIKVQHQWGQSLYAHLSKFKAVLNQPVKQGEIIGLSGNTGFSTGPHLHFGMRVKPYNKADGWYGYTNPQRYLKWPAAGVLPGPRLWPGFGRLFTASKDNGKEVDIEALTFDLQELKFQADLWEEKVSELLQRYLPGDLPDDADAMAALEQLLASWDEDLRKVRHSMIANTFEK